MCTFTFWLGGGEIDPPTTFSKRGDLTGSQFLEGVTFSWEGQGVDKKSLRTKMLSSVITKNLNCLPCTL